MADISTTSWLPFLTLVLGYATKSLEDWIQNKRSSAREREAREEARRDLRLTRRDTFQRDTLLELQDAVQRLGRATGAAQHADEMAFRKSNVWRKDLLPEEVDQSLFVAQTQTTLLSSRVRDERVRLLVGDFKAASTKVIFALSVENAFSGLRTMMSISEELHGRIGELIRTIDDDT